MLTSSYFDDLIDLYGGNPILIESIIAINDAIIGNPTPYFKQVFRGNPSNPVEIQEILLKSYEQTRDIQYLQAYNEIAIRAQMKNQREEVFPISSTYSKIEAILRENGLTLEDLTIERNRLLENLVKT